MSETELNVEVSKVIKAPIEKVFNAWIDPAQMEQWYHPEGMTTEDVSVDPKVGGAWNLVMKWDGKDMPNGGKYLEIDQPNRLVFTWNNEKSVVAIDFTKLGDNQTKVKLVHTGFVSEEQRGMHEQGWVGTVDNLAKHF